MPTQIVTKPTRKHKVVSEIGSPWRENGAALSIECVGEAVLKGRL